MLNLAQRFRSLREGCVAAVKGSAVGFAEGKLLPNAFDGLCVRDE